MVSDTLSFNCILTSSLPGSQILKCHPELVAKFVETESKRDFIPLPGVSGSYNSRTLSQFVKVGSCLIIRNQIGLSQDIRLQRIFLNQTKNFPN